MHSFRFVSTICLSPCATPGAGNATSLPGTPPPSPGDRPGYATARKHQLHSIRAVGGDSGNKDPSSREAPRVFFIGDTGARVSACGLSGGLSAPLLDHAQVPLDVRHVDRHAVLLAERRVGSGAKRAPTIRRCGLTTYPYLDPTMPARTSRLA